MHAPAILHRCLAPLLVPIHRARLAALFAAVAACALGPGLSLTDIGRRFAGATAPRHKLKRADRLLGNRALQQQAGVVYGAMCQVMLARIRAPVVLVDWSDLKADQSLHLLRASLAGEWVRSDPGPRRLAEVSVRTPRAEEMDSAKTVKHGSKRPFQE